MIDTGSKITDYLVEVGIAAMTAGTAVWHLIKGRVKGCVNKSEEKTDIKLTKLEEKIMEEIGKVEERCDVKLNTLDTNAQSRVVQLGVELKNVEKRITRTFSEWREYELQQQILREERAAKDREAQSKAFDHMTDRIDALMKSGVR